MTINYWYWLILLPVGMLLMAIQFHTPDPVADSIINLLSDNSITIHVGIRPILTLILLLWQFSGMTSFIMGIVGTFIGYKRNR